MGMLKVEVIGLGQGQGEGVDLLKHGRDARWGWAPVRMWWLCGKVFSG